MKVKTYLMALLVLVAATSCSSRKTALTYFKDIDAGHLAAVPADSYLPEIKPDDELLITVTSPNPEATAIYNLPSVNPATKASASAPSTSKQQTYVVSSKGDIDFPGLGRLHVAGKNVEQVQEEILAGIRADVADAQVYVSLENFYVNVAGEVERPGRLKVNSNRFTVLDALSEAGDLTPYGERDNVLVIREKDGKRESVRLNLSSAEALNSPFFYLEQNDYIYVEPNKIRESNSRYNQQNSYRLQVATTIVSVASVITSLVIALTR